MHMHMCMHIMHSMHMHMHMHMRMCMCMCVCAVCLQEGGDHTAKAAAHSEYAHTAHTLLCTR